MGRKATVDVDARSYGVYLSEEQRNRVNILAFLKSKTRSEIIRDVVQAELDKFKDEIDAIIAARDIINQKREP